LIDNNGVVNINNVYFVKYILYFALLLHDLSKKVIVDQHNVNQIWLTLQSKIIIYTSRGRLAIFIPYILRCHKIYQYIMEKAFHNNYTNYHF
jgi:hypothetical protein